MVWLLEERGWKGKGEYLELPVKERETRQNVESRRPPDVSSEEEGAKANPSAAKGHPSGPEKSGRKKGRKKKKKKASQDPEKSPGKNKKQPIFQRSSFELLPPQSDEGRTSGTPKRAPGQTLGTGLLGSTSALFFLAAQEDHFAPPNESLRWEGTLDDPVAEEERLWNYRLNRRKRYGAFLQQNLSPTPSFTLRNLPELCQAAQTNGEYSPGRSESSLDTSGRSTKTKADLTSQIITKGSASQPGLC
uniref:Protein LIAT1 isoform X1 n=1 Tax=Pogona vitticeps TaxID=103695 RepID=A0ABM5ENF7_9SAUR